MSYAGPVIGPGMQGSWSNAALQIPIVCPSLLNFCRIIKLDYKLQLIVSVNKVSFGKILNIPIVIGTVPLNSNSVPVNPTINYMPIVDGNGGLTNQQNAQEIKANNSVGVGDNENEPTNFIPRYPYYQDFSA